MVECHVLAGTVVLGNNKNESKSQVRIPLDAVRAQFGYKQDLKMVTNVSQVLGFEKECYGQSTDPVFSSDLQVFPLSASFDLKNVDLPKCCPDPMASGSSATV